MPITKNKIHFIIFMSKQHENVPFKATSNFPVNITAELATERFNLVDRINAPGEDNDVN